MFRIRKLLRKTWQVSFINIHIKCTKIHYFNFLGTKVTVIDTPGFGDDIENEEQTIEELVDVLKNQIRFVHVFIIAFNGESPRLQKWLLSFHFGKL